ncbi:GNAT family N-acetyltransferase [Micromonospora sp. 4G57]|uniref:GNAT family N-acetyltransferase n=1 Tax=Micromonospora sicca TaxID=2202420 RepID=A0ABU5JJK4_9ACTN|nr:MULTISPECIES: GNAT family N-acetyltransferase [unclassified Micromonospora]MDZ5441498.1 GNAT family N-acetyltransferase [Micromonospora sp. 4G57]MDZ5492820.1 GNAT family N-acetyltransferase [Micromonospora sp. 4G53]
MSGVILNYGRIGQTDGRRESAERRNFATRDKVAHTAPPGWGDQRAPRLPRLVQATPLLGVQVQVHRGQALEMGWAVLPGYQGRGLATAAVRAAVAAAAARGDRRWAHAYPSVDNPPSNAVCRKAGFTLVGETEFEYPPGHLMRSNDWRVDLTAERE